MPYDENDDTIIRNGNLRQFLSYKVGPHALKGWWIITGIITAVALVAFGIGKLL